MRVLVLVVVVTGGKSSLLPVLDWAGSLTIEEPKEGVVDKHKDEARDKHHSDTEEYSHDTSNHEGWENIAKEFDTDDEATLSNADPLW